MMVTCYAWFRENLQGGCRIVGPVKIEGKSMRAVNARACTLARDYGATSITLAWDAQGLKLVR